MRSSWKPSGRSGPTARCTLTFAGARAATASARCSAVTAPPGRSRRAGRSRSPTAARRGWPGRCRRPAAAPRPPRGCPPSGRARRAGPCGAWRRRRRRRRRWPARSPGGRRPPDQGDQAGVDVRLGPEHLAADAAGPAHLAVPGGLHRRDAVRRAAGRRGQPLGDLGLHQDQRAVQRRAAARAGAAAPGRRRCRAGWRPAPSAAGPGSSWMRSASASTTVEPVGQVGPARGHRARQQLGQPRVDLDGDHARRRPAAGPGSASPGRDRPRGRRRRAAGPAVRTIRRIVLASCRKFCPSVLVGRRSSCWASSRMAAGPSSPSDCSGGVLSGDRSEVPAAVRPLAGTGALCRAAARGRSARPARPAAGRPVPPTDLPGGDGELVERRGSVAGAS